MFARVRWYIRADCDFQSDDGGFFAHHPRVRASPVARAQPLLIGVFGWAVAFTLSLLGGGCRAVRRRDAEWHEALIYYASVLLWFGGHFATHRSVTLALLPHAVFGAVFSVVTQLNHIQVKRCCS